MEKEKDKARKSVGKTGEDEACAFLVEKGHTILDRNWRSGHLELDIVTMDRRGIHFVEVKSRRPPMQGGPLDSVNLPKQKKLTTAALRYLAAKSGNRTYDRECSFDVVTVVFDRDGVKVEYFPDAFIPVYYGR